MSPALPSGSDERVGSFKPAVASLPGRARRRRPADLAADAMELVGSVRDGIDGLARPLGQVAANTGREPTFRQYLTAEVAGAQFPKLQFGPSLSPQEGRLWLIENVFVRLDYGAGALAEWRYMQLFLTRLPTWDATSTVELSSAVATVKLEGSERTVAAPDNRNTTGNANFGRPLIWRPGFYLALYDNQAAPAVRCWSTVQIHDVPDTYA